MQIIRSNRKTMGLELKADGELVVRVPYAVTDEPEFTFMYEEPYVRTKPALSSEASTLA